MAKVKLQIYRRAGDGKHELRVKSSNGQTMLASLQGYERKRGPERMIDVLREAFAAGDFEVEYVDEPADAGSAA